MIELARQRNEGIRFEQASIFDIKGSFDVVLAYNVLHVVEDAESVAARIEEILKDGGRFVSVTPCMQEQGALRAVAFLMGALRILQVRSFSIEELRAIIGARFGIVEIQNLSPHHVLIVARKGGERTL